MNGTKTIYISDPSLVTRGNLVSLLTGQKYTVKTAEEEPMILPKYRVETFETPDELLAKLKVSKPDAVIMSEQTDALRAFMEKTHIPGIVYSSSAASGIGPSSSAPKQLSANVWLLDKAWTKTETILAQLEELTKPESSRAAAR